MTQCTQYNQKMIIIYVYIVNDYVTYAQNV